MTDLSTMADVTLLRRMSAGDEEAFTVLMLGAGDRLLAIAFRILRDVGRAEDAVQIAWVSAWRDLPGLRDPLLFDAWLTKLLVRACYGEARRNRRWNANLRELPLEGPAGRDTTLTVGDRDQLDRAFGRLTAEQRAVFVLHHYLGWSQVELATTLDMPVGTVKSRLHYATKVLRAAIDADARTRTTEEQFA
jgi:RNA polymerase sigma-70 factor (ECF subfamily)